VVDLGELYMAIEKQPVVDERTGKINALLESSRIKKSVAARLGAAAMTLEGVGIITGGFGIASHNSGIIMSGVGLATAGAFCDGVARMFGIESVNEHSDANTERIIAECTAVQAPAPDLAEFQTNNMIQPANQSPEA
jgi:hypothetical protein